MMYILDDEQDNNQPTLKHLREILKNLGNTKLLVVGVRCAVYRDGGICISSRQYLESLIDQAREAGVPVLHISTRAVTSRKLRLLNSEVFYKNVGKFRAKHEETGVWDDEVLFNFW